MLRIGLRVKVRMKVRVRGKVRVRVGLGLILRRTAPWRGKSGRSRKRVYTSGMRESSYT
jgi:hypothetical protein